MNANAANFDPHRQGYVANPYDSAAYASYPSQQQQMYPPENPYSMYDPESIVDLAAKSSSSVISKPPSPEFTCLYV